ncbi:hypothetical protein [Alishewanella phage vB_AspM_Slicko01]|nr:hypothetical protein [Alishewanella phage vB_AspM_Slicko01]
MCNKQCKMRKDEEQLSLNFDETLDDVKLTQALSSILELAKSPHFNESVERNINTVAAVEWELAVARQSTNKV